LKRYIIDVWFFPSAIAQNAILSQVLLLRQQSSHNKPLRLDAFILNPEFKLLSLARSFIGALYFEALHFKSYHKSVCGQGNGIYFL
jgi:hypothetical protein